MLLDAHGRIGGSVALLAEGVDRNLLRFGVADDKGAVALLAEGVDRNDIPPDTEEALWASPSSRRAWIEISLYLWLAA